MGWTEIEIIGNKIETIGTTDLDRPGVGVWVSLLTRSMRREGMDEHLQTDWGGALAQFVAEFRRHPGRMLAWEVRDYLWRRGELGGRMPARSLRVAMDCLAYFYGKVVPRPALEAAARQPFAGLDLAPAEWIEPWLDSLREDLACQGAALEEFDRQRPNLRAELHEQGTFPDTPFRARLLALLSRDAKSAGPAAPSETRIQLLARLRPEASRRKRPDATRTRSLPVGMAGLDFFKFFGWGKTQKPA